MRNSEKQLKFFKITTFFLLTIILLGILFSSELLSRFCPKPKIEDELTEKAKPLTETEIGRNFEFPVKKYSKDKFKLNLLKVSKVKMVTTKNQPVLAKEGEAFLLLYLETENNLETPIIIDIRNYFRLLGENDKKFAPDFYNGQVQIEPISSKKDQIGFVIKENQKEFKLQVGEVEEKKEEVVFSF